MLRGSRIILGLIAGLMAFSVPAEETRRDEFGDWGFVCNKPDNQEEARESCNLFQTALLNAGQQGEQAEGQAGAQRVLLTRVGYLEGNDKPVLLVTAPLGILLPLGITVEVEGHDEVRIPVQRCDAGGCLAYVVMEEEFLDALEKAEIAQIEAVEEAEKAIKKLEQEAERTGKPVDKEKVAEERAKTRKARVTFYDAQRRGVTIPLSLKGFTKGMHELEVSRS